MYKYVKLSPEDRCLLQGINQKLCALETGASFDGQLVQDGAPVSDANPLPVELAAGSGGLTDAELRASPVEVDGSGVTQPISAASLPLPTGAATAANQATGNSSLTTIATNTTGLATASNQSTANASLTTIAANTTGLNAAIKAEDSTSASGDSLVHVGGIRMDSDVSPVSADGDYHSLIFNATGRAKVSIKPGATVATTGTITANAQTVFMECARESTATLTYTGTFTGLNTTFEFSLDSTNGTDGSWFALLGARTNTEIIETTSGVVATGLAYGWQFALPGGTTYIRTRATAFTSGTANVTWKPGALSYDPIARVSTLGAGTATVGVVQTSNMVPGVANTNLGKAEDAVHASGDTGVFMLGVRQDSQTTVTTANGDYSLMAVDQYGNNLARNYGTIRKTYSSSFTFTPGATATDSVEIIGVNAVSIQITKIIIGGIATSATAYAATLIRRSTLNSGGTSANQVLTKHEAADANSAVTVKLYSVNPTSLGTSVGTVRSLRVPLGTASDPRAAITYTFGSDSKPIILAGSTETLCLNFNGAAVPAGASIDFTVEYTEL